MRPTIYHAFQESHITIDVKFLVLGYEINYITLNVIFKP